MPPEAAKPADLSTFFRLLKKYDPGFHTRYTVAMAGGKKLRYVASIDSGSAKVELLDLGESHPFFALRGSENCIILTTKYYKQYPMVIKGPGAGIDVTAAGLLADIIRIAEGIRV
jgi:aspartokinase/homoserine dehydrogenase 1